MGKIPKETGFYWTTLTFPRGAAAGSGVEESLRPWFPQPSNNWAKAIAPLGLTAGHQEQHPYDNNNNNSNNNYSCYYY